MSGARRVVIADRAALIAEFVAAVDSAVSDATPRGAFSMAVPGGSAAEQLLPALAHANLPWNYVHLFWCDERGVPADDADSNAGLLMRLWKRTPALAHAQLHPMPATDPDRASAAARYARELESICGSPPTLDMVLLGVGEDGHVASLFPGRAYRGGDVSVVAVSDAPKPPPERMSLTFSVLSRARAVIVAAFGTSKAAVMSSALAGTTNTPVARVLHEAPSALVLLDRDAGALIDTHLESR
ncbi:MAG TPA: 6-phosphogluconolactonase [Gemmatimonadaceae bacterium]|nr:6-phosphogluconolactonase [Gemmatimonadaceae bacterium]